MINRKKLINELESVKKGISSKNLIEQSNSFIFTKNKIITYNDDVYAMTSTDVDIEGVIEAESLLKLLYKIKDEEIKVGVNDNELQIKGKKFSSGILLDSEIRLPIDDVTIPKKMIKLKDDFTECAKQACLTAGKALSEPILTCVHIYENKIESCDNDRITICNLKQEFGFDILVPAKNLFDLCTADLTSVYVDDSWIHFKTNDGVFLSTRLFNEKFLDVQQFIPDTDVEKNIIKFPSEINDILARADTFSKDAHSQEKNVQITINKKKMEITSQNEIGWFKERILTKCTEDFSFTINIEFLLGILRTTNEIFIIDNMIYFETDNSIHLIQLNGKEND